MLIKLKNKDTLEFGCFKFKCCIGQNNIKKKKLKEIKLHLRVFFQSGQYTIDLIVLINP